MMSARTLFVLGLWPPPPPVYRRRRRVSTGACAKTTVFFLNRPGPGLRWGPAGNWPGREPARPGPGPGRDPGPRAGRGRPSPAGTRAWPGRDPARPGPMGPKNVKKLQNSRRKLTTIAAGGQTSLQNIKQYQHSRRKLKKDAAGVQTSLQNMKNVFSTYHTIAYHYVHRNSSCCPHGLVFDRFQV